MYKTKAELEAIAVALGDETFETMVDGIIKAREYFERFITVLNSAECRIMCAAAAVGYRAGGPDEGEA
jgi:hypothetical protein